MDHSKITEEFAEDQIRTETIIHLGTMCHDYAFPDVADDAFSMDIDEMWEAMGLAGPDDDEDASNDSIGSYLMDNKKLGFLVKVATPIPERFTKTGYSTNGWGYYMTQWLYAETLEEVFEKAKVWAAEYIESKRAAEEKTPLADEGLTLAV